MAQETRRNNKIMDKSASRKWETIREGKKSQSFGLVSEWKNGTFLWLWYHVDIKFEKWLVRMYCTEENVLFFLIQNSNRQPVILYHHHYHYHYYDWDYEWVHTHTPIQNKANNYLLFVVFSFQFNLSFKFDLK